MAPRRPGVPWVLHDSDEVYAMVDMSTSRGSMEVHRHRGHDSDEAYGHEVHRHRGHDSDEAYGHEVHRYRGHDSDRCDPPMRPATALSYFDCEYFRLLSRLSSPPMRPAT